MPFSQSTLEKLSVVALRAALDAGSYIAEHSDGNIKVEHKEGGEHLASQVVTEVDLKCNAIIETHLLPTLEEYNIAILTEEGGDDGGRLEKEAFWCVDPLDGTLSFTEGLPGYSVSIALVSEEGVPLTGVIYNPVTKRLYSAIKGAGAMLDGRPWMPELNPPHGGGALTAVFDPSTEEADNYGEILAILEGIAKDMGLSGIKTMHRGGAVVNACRVLENAPACYFKLPRDRDGGGSLWDFAASACIYSEIGAISTDFSGRTLELNRLDSTFMNHRGVMYASTEELAERIRAAISDSGQLIINNKNM